MSKIVVPWNQTTLSGYLAEDFYIFFWGGAFFVATGTVLLLFISICIYHTAFRKMFEHSIDKFNQNSSLRQYDEQFVFDLMRFHIEAQK